MGIKMHKLLLILAVAFTAMLAIGCSSGTQTLNPEHQAVAAEEEQIAVPEEEPTFAGMVKEIVGNEVTVYQAEAPEQAPAREEAPGENPPGTAGRAANPNNDELRPEPSPGNRPPGPQVTEETITFTIPDGTPVVTLQRGSNEAVPMDLSDIKANQFLWVWQKDYAVNFVQLIGGVGPEADGPEAAGSSGSGTAKPESTSAN